MASVLLLSGARTEPPGKNGAPPPPDDLELARDLVYGKAGGHDLTLDILKSRILPEGKHPAILWIHGGGWRTGSKDAPQHIPRLVPYARDGYVCVLVEYRLTPEAPFPAQIQDVKCAVRFLRAKAGELGIDPDRIGAWGASAGGHLASLLALSGGVAEFEGNGGWPEHSSRVTAACALAGPSDLVAMLEGPEAGDESFTRKIFTLFVGGDLEKGRPLLERADPAKYVSPDDPPVLLMHGDADKTVPPAQSVHLHEVLKKAGLDATLVIAKGGGHGVGQTEISRHVPEFFERHLKPRKDPLR